MNVIVLGAAGFIGTNLALKLAQEKENRVTLVDSKKEYFNSVLSHMDIVECEFALHTDFDELLSGQDVVYHLVSTITPATSNLNIAGDFMDNIVVTAKMLEACVRQKVKKVVFISSGGAVYGKNVISPIKEDDEQYPITSYGIQKLTIEKTLHMLYEQHGLDYRIIRLANPYGPYQRPNGKLGVVTTFVYKCLNNEPVTLYGDGTVVRDFIYIDDAVELIIKISQYDGNEKLFNLGSGKGTSIKEVIRDIEDVLRNSMYVQHGDARNVDVPISYLNIDRLKKAVGNYSFVPLKDGIQKTAEFLMKQHY